MSKSWLEDNCLKKFKEEISYKEYSKNVIDDFCRTFNPDGDEDSGFYYETEDEAYEVCRWFMIRNVGAKFEKIDNCDDCGYLVFVF